ncbi:hypothetical protein LC55x_0218 [Lysobacter capsici]|nr:hypothetical protein LC55x_0218 [Lysobacter capsici]
MRPIASSSPAEGYCHDYLIAACAVVADSRSRLARSYR